MSIIEDVFFIFSPTFRCIIAEKAMEEQYLLPITSYLLLPKNEPMKISNEFIISFKPLNKCCLICTIISCITIKAQSFLIF